MGSVNLTKSAIVLGGSGCFLPFLLVFNLFFGWIFLGFLPWMAVQALLVLLFLFSAALTAKKLNSSSKHEDVIDVEAKVMDDGGNASAQDKIEEKH